MLNSHQLACAVLCLYVKCIIPLEQCDNELVHQNYQNNIELADFGLSKRLIPDCTKCNDYIGLEVFNNNTTKYWTPIRIATEVDKEKTYNFYLGTEDENDGFSVAQYNLGFICEIYELGDTTQVMYLV
ncbi:hypothetical protein RhiirB3_426755 [Rhizophagus irregularis]|nr:hypothetical protein RhiirB3_426755 [Rhizophagus irregularis]